MIGWDFMDSPWCPVTAPPTISSQHDAEVPQVPFNATSSFIVLVFLFKAWNNRYFGLLWPDSDDHIPSFGSLIRDEKPDMICFCRTFIMRAFSRCSVQSGLQWFIHAFIHWWRWLPCKVPSSASGAVWGFSILPKNTSTCRPGESNQLPSDNKMLALPLSHSRQSEELYPSFAMTVFICLWQAGASKSDNGRFIMLIFA